jgi:type I restriction enzyme M protein
MFEFLSKQVTDFSENDFEKKYKHLDDSVKKSLLEDFFRVRLEKNNEFAIKDVFDHQSFEDNAKVVKEVVELLQKYRIRYNKRQQYLSDFFELLLTTGLKQESGQFFTPVPIAQFIIKSLPIEAMIHEKIEKGEKNNLLPYIIDYAAGSGHFLTESMHEVQGIINKKTSEDFIPDTAKKIKSWQEDHFDWATQYVYGIEKDYRLVKVGKVGCYLHGDGLANVILSDGLA